WKVSVQKEGLAPLSVKIESKTQYALVDKRETGMKPDGTPEIVMIRPFGKATFDFVLIPADQVKTAKAPPAGTEAPAAGGGDATDPLMQAVQKVAAGDLAGS